MSRGLSKRQRVILGLLDGKLKRLCFSGGGGMLTKELALELEHYGAMPHDVKPKQALATIRRACDSLVRRGLIHGVYERDADNGAMSISWAAGPAPEPKPTAQERR